MFELYDFRFSHYSEKARWALDYKGVTYASRHLLPGFHLHTTRKLAPRTCVPILKAGDIAIQGSTRIINFPKFSPVNNLSRVSGNTSLALSDIPESTVEQQLSSSFSYEDEIPYL